MFYASHVTNFRIMNSLDYNLYLELLENKLELHENLFDFWRKYAFADVFFEEICVFKLNVKCLFNIIGSTK